MTKMTNSSKEESHIKIASWNINKFESSSVAEITKIIVDENLDIIFLHEFPTNKIFTFMNELNETSKTQYDLISQQSSYERDYNITLVLVKENLKAYIKTIPVIDDMPFKLRLIELELFIKNNTINILGLHCPIYVNKMDNLKRNKQIDIFWDKLLDYLKSKELMLIGDFNVNLLKQNKFTRKLKNVMDIGYIDLDSELKQNTFIANTRIDYVLTYNSLATLYANHTLITPRYIQDNSRDSFNYSDHKMIITEIIL